MKILALISMLILSLFSHGAETEPELFDEFWNNTASSFKNEKTYYHLAAIALTPLLIYTGVDADIHNRYDNSSPSDVYRPGVVAGFIGPLLLGIPLYIHSRTASNRESLLASYALTQTTVITLSYISLLKGLTGRPPPNNSNSTSAQDQSEVFHFGISQRGIIWGWPSGHVGMTTALMSTLTNYYAESLWLKFAGSGVVAYMMLTISANDNGQMHWFSDGVAGALMGYAIGSTVGSNFRKKLNKQQPQEVSYTLLPLIDSHRSGIQVVWQY